MWVLKTHGETFYVNHVDCEIPWSTKETEDNPHTKGSIKVKDALLTINEDNEATLSRLTLIDKIRLRNQKLGITRVIVKEGQSYFKFQDVLKKLKIKHSPIKSIGGSCSSTFYIADILKEEQFTMVALAMSGMDFRILKPNESYYKWYDDPKNENKNHIWEEDYYELDDDDE